jgi:hypothetical protein
MLPWAGMAGLVTIYAHVEVEASLTMPNIEDLVKTTGR